MKTLAFFISNCSFSNPDPANDPRYDYTLNTKKGIGIYLLRSEAFFINENGFSNIGNAVVLEESANGDISHNNFFWCDPTLGSEYQRGVIWLKNSPLGTNGGKLRVGFNHGGHNKGYWLYSDYDHHFRPMEIISNNIGANFYSIIGLKKHDACRIENNWFDRANLVLISRNHPFPTRSPLCRRIRTSQ